MQLCDCRVLFRLYLQSAELSEQESLVQLLDFAASRAVVTKEDSTKERRSKLGEMVGRRLVD